MCNDLELTNEEKTSITPSKIEPKKLLLYVRVGPIPAIGSSPDTDLRDTEQGYLLLADSFPTLTALQLYDEQLPRQGQINHICCARGVD
jgi:hypothetical protein